MHQFHDIHETDAEVISDYEDVEDFLKREGIADDAEEIYEYHTLIEKEIEGAIRPAARVNPMLYECGDQWVLGLRDIEGSTYIYWGDPADVMDVLFAEYDRFGVEDDVVTKARQSADPVEVMRGVESS